MTSTLIASSNKVAMASLERHFHTSAGTFQGLIVQGIEPGLSHYQQGQFKDAIRAWQLALNERQLPDHRLQQAEIWNYLSLAYQRLEQWHTADQASQHSLKLLEGHSEHGSQGPYLQLYARILNTRGRSQWALGQSEAALKTWAHATQLYRQMGDATGTKGSLVNQALAMERLGLYHRACQTILLALAQDLNCHISGVSDVDGLLQIFEQQQDSALKRVVLRNLGNILRVKGNFEQAQKLLSATQPAQQPPLEASITYISMGKTAQARYEQFRASRRRSARSRKPLSMAYTALAYYQKADQQAATLPASNSLLLQSQLHQLNLLLSMAQEYALLEREIKPQIETLVASLENSSLDTLAPSRSVIYAQLNFAQALIQVTPSQTLTTSALHYAQTALRGAEFLQDQRAQSFAFGTLGKIHEQVQDWTLAQARTETALGLSQAMQASDLTAQWQWQLGRIAVAQNQTKRAIAAYQAAITHVNGRRDTLLSASPDVQFSFQETVEPIYRQLTDLLLREQGKTLDEQGALQLAIATIDDFRRVELENLLNCDLSTLISLEQQSVDPAAAILYPIILDDRIDVIIKLPNGEPLRYFTTPLAQGRVNQTLDHLRRELERPVISKKGLRLSQQVYDWLIRPAEALLEAQEVHTLVFVLDGSLRDVPVAALHDRNQYLIEKGYAVGLIPGLQLFEPESLRQDHLRALSFGLSQVSPHAPHLAPLPNVETELTQLQAKLRTKQYLNETFTHRTLQNSLQISPAQIVHFATHGQFSSDPDQTFIQAWDQPILGQTLSTILKRRTQATQVPIELLVLSACETAVGDERATLGLAGLAIQSGARSTLATLWSVDDRSTAEFMGHFYQVLSEQNASKAEAIRQSQMKLLQTQGYRSPRYWAPFVLVGNWL